MEGYNIVEFVCSDGSIPFRDWLGTLDKPIRARIYARLFRFESGNLGDHKSVGEGVFEARFHFGSGFRVYFGKDGQKVVVLLCAGGKKTQQKDIARAKQYWKTYSNAVL